MNTTGDICPGCEREFAPGGYSNHFRFSHDPRCGSLWSGVVPGYTAVTRGSFTGSRPSTPCPTDSDVPMLDTSLGSQSDGFPSPSHDPIHIPVDSNNNNGHGGHDGEGHADRLLETVFSCPLQTAASTADPDTDTESEASDEEEESQPVSQSSHSSQDIGQPEPLDVHGGYLCCMVCSFLTVLGIQNDGDPTVVKFGSRAGEALPIHPERVGYAEYSHALGREDIAVSEWAPFSTRMEWEIARWAKLRGPSSTALSELLKIGGVSRITSLFSVFG